MGVLRRTRARPKLALLALSAAVLPVIAVTATSAGASIAQAKKIVYLGCDEANPFCASYNKTMETHLRKAGYSVSSLYNNFDPVAQAQQMSQATAQRPTAIVVFVADSTAIVPSLARAHAAGVKVIVVGSPVIASGLKYVALENLQNSSQLGKFAAMNLVAGMKKEGLKRGNIIALTGTKSQIDVQRRMAAFEKYLKHHQQGRYKLVAAQDAGWDPIKSASLAKTLYAKYASKGGIQGVYGMADYMATAAAGAAKSSGLKVGLPKGIVFTGSNCSTAGIKAMKTGQLFGDATQSPKVEASAAAHDTIRLLNGKKMKKVILNRERRFTKHNMKKYVKQCTY